MLASSCQLPSSSNLTQEIPCVCFPLVQISLHHFHTGSRCLWSSSSFPPLHFPSPDFPGSGIVSSGSMALTHVVGNGIFACSHTHTWNKSLLCPFRAWTQHLSQVQFCRYLRWQRNTRQGRLSCISSLQRQLLCFVTRFPTCLNVFTIQPVELCTKNVVKRVRIKCIWLVGVIQELWLDTRNVHSQLPIKEDDYRHPQGQSGNP